MSLLGCKFAFFSEDHLAVFLESLKDVHIFSLSDFLGQFWEKNAEDAQRFMCEGYSGVLLKLAKI